MKKVFYIQAVAFSLLVVLVAFPIFRKKNASPAPPTVYKPTPPETKKKANTLNADGRRMKQT